MPIKMLKAALKFNDPYDLNLFGPVIEKRDNPDAIIKEDPMEMMNRGKLALRVPTIIGCNTDESGPLGQVEKFFLLGTLCQLSKNDFSKSTTPLHE